MTVLQTKGSVGKISLDRVSQHVALITIDSPPANNLSYDVRRPLFDAFNAAHDDLDVRSIVVTGAGRFFTSGDNLKLQLNPPEIDRATEFKNSFGHVLNAMEHGRVPVIAAINGDCMGGGLEFALACDIRIADPSARFMCAGVNVGLILSWHRLTRTIGLGPAKEMLLTGRKVPAEEALRVGLVTEVTDSGEVMRRALEIAEMIATRAPLSVEATKACTTRAFDLSAEEANRLQSQEAARMAATADHIEALRGFVEKRPPRFERK